MHLLDGLQYHFRADSKVRFGINAVAHYLSLVIASCEEVQMLARCEYVIASREKVHTLARCEVDILFVRIFKASLCLFSTYLYPDHAWSSNKKPMRYPR